VNVTPVNAPVTVRSQHSRLTPPPGLAYLASALREAGHHVSAVDFDVSGLASGRVDRIVEIDQPLLVGISTLTEAYPSAREIARRVKAKNPGVRVVMGGAPPSIGPRQVPVHESVDFVVEGDGVAALPELAASLSGEGLTLDATAGLGY